MSHYEQAKIYKLCSEVDDKFYVGSTTSPLHKVVYMHKLASKKYPNRSVYIHFNSFNWQTVKPILIENYPCKSKEELVARERYWYDKLCPQLKTFCPPTNDEEIREYKRERAREYRVDNLEKERERGREYYSNNIERCRANSSKPWTCTVCNCTIRQDTKSRHLKSAKHLAHFEDIHILTEASESESQASSSES